MKLTYSIALPLMLLSLSGQAELRVIADLGGESTEAYFESINKQEETALSPPLSTPSVSGLAAMLPVRTPELSPGAVADRPLNLPGIGALFLVGDDALSRAWLIQHAATLRERRAVGMIVNVERIEAVQALRDAVPQLLLVPASGSELAQRLQLQHYPVLISDSLLTQQKVQP
ncbi:integrating conjugative element protein [Serratia microhaemolytica]|uniref:integrating conjugative element protein n=1 Tax=Serratia microhaemolytica TaxID=2675110 RepID=UPI000FDF57C7|nr:integrating conjugative element protein [Serratia microhaemolytica]